MCIDYFGLLNYRVYVKILSDICAVIPLLPM